MKSPALFIVAILMLLHIRAAAQCSTHITSFPYTEGFEASNGGWTTGGTSSSWQWGVIAKPVITTAGQGTRAWSTGRINGNAYNDGEGSWLMSPCFNFSSLINPMISFLVFWEMEQRFDGANIEYSTNGGNTWQILGSENSNATCAGENWFNYFPVRYMGNAPGWSGNIQPTAGSCLGGGGSGGWLRAKHTVGFLAAMPSVRFRFNFGAGTTCNQFDGFAIDDFRVEETPASSSSFTFTCLDNRTVQFYTPNRVCQTGVQWDFGDPASGAANTSTDFEPTHVFSSAGVYTVQMTATFSNAAPSVSTTQVTVLDAVASVTQPIVCFGGTGNVAVNVTPPGTYTYTWNATPLPHTNVLQNVAAGVYEVTVEGSGACATMAQVSLQQPPLLEVDVVATDASCTTPTGSVNANVNGGQAPYTYLWNTGGTSAQLLNQPAGNYTVTITDALGCTIQGNATIDAPSGSITLQPNITPAICGGSNGAIHLTINGGTGPYVAVWNNGATGTSLTDLLSGNYSVTVTDAGGCTASLNNIIVPEDPIPGLIVDYDAVSDTCQKNVGSISVTLSGGTPPYQIVWNTGATGSVLTGAAAGSYDITVTDTRGCVWNQTGLMVGHYQPVISLSEQITHACNGDNGAIALSASGGTPPYAYLWSNGASGASIQNLSPGVYTVQVTDRNGCTPVTGSFTVDDLPVNIEPNVVTTPPTCGSSNGNIQLQPSGGVSPYSITWSNGTTGTQLQNIMAGTYSAVITDARGCASSTGDIVLTNIIADLEVSLGPTRNICASQSILLQPGTGFTTYLWQDGSTASTYTVTAPGDYSVRVTDSYGCSGSSTVTITGFCGDLYFSSAFTPNGDGLNDNFGALGETAGVSNYLLVVYGRWGQEVFRTNNPAEKWDGTYKGKLQHMQTFVYMARYTIGARMPQLVKGTVTLVL